MDNFSSIFEKINKVEEQEVRPEDILTHKIEDEIKRLTVAMKGDYWFHDDIKISEVSVLNWIKENRTEFYKKAIIEPETVEGSDVIVDALTALRLVKEWHEVEYDELQTPEDRSNWKIAQGL